MIALAAAVALASVVLWRTVFLGFVPVPADVLYSVEPWRSEAESPVLGDAVWNPLMTDSLWQVVPEGIAAHRLWSEGLPLWDSNPACGVPGLAQGRMYSNPFFNLIAGMTGPIRAIGWTALLQLTVALWGMYLLARQTGVIPAAAALAALAFGFNLYLLVWLPHTSFFGAMVWLPLLFFAYERSLATERASWAALGAVVFAVQILEGHIPTPFFGAVTLGVWSCVRGFARVRASRRVGALLRPVATAGGLLVVGALLVAPQLLATVELFFQTPRGEAIGAITVIPFDQGVRLVAPWFWGHRFHGGTYVGPFNVAELGLYFGVLPLALIVVAPLAARRLEGWFFSIAAGVCGLVIFDIPPLRAVVGWIYPIVYQSFPGRIFAIAALCGSLAAGLGAHWLLVETGRRQRRRWAVAVLLFTAAAWTAAGWVALVHRPRAIAEQGGAQWIVWLEQLRVESLLWAGLWSALAAVLVLGIRRHGPRGAVLRWALAVIVALDLLHTGSGLIPFFPPDEVLPPTPTIERLTDLVAGSEHQGRILPVPSRRVIAGQVPTAFDLPSVTTYSSWPLTRYERYAWLSGLRSSPWPFIYFDDCCGSLMNGLGARFVVAPLDLEPRSLHRPRGLRLLRDGPVRIWQNRRALPRARVVHSVRFAPPGDLDEVARILGSQGFRLRREVVLESEPIDLDPPAGGGGMERAAIVRDRPTHVEIEIDAESPGVLVLADTWYPGWEATIDGEPADVLPANLAVRGVVVPAGRSTVEFRYRPAWLVPGVMLSLLAAACLASTLRPG